MLYEQGRSVGPDMSVAGPAGDREPHSEEGRHDHRHAPLSEGGGNGAYQEEQGAGCLSACESEQCMPLACYDSAATSRFRFRVGLGFRHATSPQTNA